MTDKFHENLANKNLISSMSGEGIKTFLFSFKNPKSLIKHFEILVKSLKPINF